jgi:iron complex outermembrane receptor protein
VWAYRLNGVGRRADEQIDYSKQQRIVVSPTLSWTPDGDTSVSLYGLYQNDPDNNFAGWLPAQGTLFSSPTGRIPRSFFLGDPSYDDYDRQQYMVGYRAEHTFDNGWTLRQNFRYSAVQTAFKGLAGNYYSPFGSTTSELSRLAMWDKERLNGIAVDSQAEYQADTGALEHKIVAGLSYQQTLDNNRQSGWGYVSAIDYLAPDYAQSITSPDLASVTRQKTQQTGIYLQDQIRVDRLVVTVGARQDWVTSDTDNELTSASQSQNDHAFTGRVGAVYLFENGLAPYVSYATSFQPTSGVDAGGSGYKPSKGRQIEAGLRYEPATWNGSFTASAFDIHRTNVSVTDPDNPLYYVQTGEARSRGAEFEAKAGLTDNIDLIGAYTVLDTTVEKDTDASVIGKRLAGVPRQMVSAWLNYTVTSGPMNGLSVATGVRYIGKSAGDSANSLEVPGASLFDAAIRYDFGENHINLKGWHAAANVTNLFNKTYVSSCFSSGGCFYGNGRTVTASLHYTW